MKIVIDIETDSLTPTKIWLLVVKDIDKNETFTFFDAIDAQRWFKNNRIDLCIAHNGIGFDWFYLDKLWGIKIRREICRDTLVLSRLLDQPLQGGHSLEAWGERLKFPKGTFSDFSKLSYEMIEYCIQDVNLTHALWNHLSKEFISAFTNSWSRSINTEHEMAWICQDMHENGFSFNYTRAKEIYADIDQQIQILDKDILEAYKPIRKLLGTKEPRYKKDGTLHNYFSKALATKDVEFKDNLFYFYEWEEFNPGSSKQIIERLDGYWNPIDKTEGHILAIKTKDKDRLQHFKKYGWKVTEQNLGTITDDAPQAAKLLVKRILLATRLRTLTTWLEAYNKDTGKIHGTYNNLGTWTHRLSHTNPNLGNVSAEKTIKYKTEEMRNIAIHYGGEMRKLFIADKDSWLIGTDMEGAHLRLFAHFINDKDLIKALVEGNKKLGTDPHTMNMKKLGSICPDRDLAKTFIFTYLNGGGVNKVMEIFKCKHDDAREALDSFVKSYPGLAELKTKIIPKWAEKGYFIGLDGRRIKCDSEHLMVAGMLQSGEKIVMAQANILWIKEAKRLDIPFKQCNLVHDEFQTNVLGDESLAHTLGKIQSEAIRQTGLDLNLHCPLAGEYKVGLDWLKTH